MKPVRLIVKQDYRCREVHYSAGTEIAVSPDRAAFLLADAPDCFALWQEEPPKAPDGPPEDKMVRRSPRKK
jgi:hypothetical protein